MKFCSAPESLFCVCVWGGFCRHHLMVLLSLKEASHPVTAVLGAEGCVCVCGNDKVLKSELCRLKFINFNGYQRKSYVLCLILGYIESILGDVAALE